MSLQSSDSTTLWTVARKAPLSMEFSSWESPGDLSDPGIQPATPALAGKVFITSATYGL